MVIKVDAKGLSCPQPVIKTKEALENAKGDPLLVMVSSAVSRDNVIRFLKNSGASIDRVEENNGEYHIYAQGMGEESKGEPHHEECICTTQTAVAGTTIFINKDRIGHGSDELGGNLIKAFIATIKDLSLQPKSICFMNGGVKLTIKGAETLPYLKELQAKGIDLLVCGTCLGFFNLKEELGVGRISNMYDISETMLMSSKVITI